MLCIESSLESQGKVDEATLSIAETAAALGSSITVDHVQARIRRGSLQAHRAEDGMWRIKRRDVQRLLDDVDPCENCACPADTYVIVKYHHHVRIEFVLCKSCGADTVSSYSRQGGVLEVRSYPFFSEGWKTS